MGINFYDERARRSRGETVSRGVVPPLEEAAWLVLGTRQENRAELADSCPGLIVATLFFISEVVSFADGATDLAVRYAREAESYAAAMQQSRPAEFETMLDMFPVRDAFTGAELARREA